MNKFSSHNKRMFGYAITTLFIFSNKDYNFYHNLHSVYQICPKFVWEITTEEFVGL